MQTRPRPVLGRSVLLTAIIALISAGPAVYSADSVMEALKQSKPLVDIRYRFEHVDQDGYSEDAKASTLRGRLGVKTGELKRFFALIEFESLIPLGNDLYNSTANGRITFPAVFDPEDTEVNRILLGYNGNEHIKAKLGRQRINLDNQRFVGAVGWRQLEQTFDSLTAQGEIVENVNYFYGNIQNVNRIFGEHNPDPVKADNNTTGNFFNVSWKTKCGKLVGYGYPLEYDDQPLKSQQTYGIRFSGHHDFNDTWTITYAGEYADQSDYKDGSDLIDASYHLVEAGFGVKKIDVNFGYEVLGGDGMYGFSTPLATLHKFNGWADVFLMTPVHGLVDMYGSVGGKVVGLNLKAVYHDFSADEGDGEYGSELDLLVSRGFGKHYSVLVKYADYSADDMTAFLGNVDKTILWIQLGVKL